MFEKRLKICRKLYGDNIRTVGRVYIEKIRNKKTGKITKRRRFYLYFYNNDPVRQRGVYYADYKMEKKLGRLLKDGEVVHHDNESTLCDKYWNLKVKLRGPHARHHMLGKHRSEETRIKISEARIGMKFSEETKNKMSINSAKYWLGKSLSEETKKKISLSMMGNKNRERKSIGNPE